MKRGLYSVWNGHYRQRIFETLEESLVYAVTCQRQSVNGCRMVVKRYGRVVFDARDVFEAAREKA